MCRTLPPFTWKRSILQTDMCYESRVQRAPGFCCITMHILVILPPVNVIYISFSTVRNIIPINYHVLTSRIMKACLFRKVGCEGTTLWRGMYCTHSSAKPSMGSLWGNECVKYDSATSIIFSVFPWVGCFDVINKTIKQSLRGESVKGTWLHRQ